MILSTHYLAESKFFPVITFHNKTKDMMLLKWNDQSSKGERGPRKLQRCRASFSTLAQLHKFKQIQRVLEEDADGFDHTSWLNNTNTRKGSNRTLQLFKAELPLHILLNYRPPVYLVDLLIKKLATGSSDNPVTATDMLGRTPLHVAVANRCDVAVVDRLLQKSSLSSSTTVRDYWGRTPLHWAVVSDNSADNGFRGFCVPARVSTTKLMEALENQIKTVCTLIEDCFELLFIRDEDGRTPLELAVHHQADGIILYLLAGRATSTKKLLKFSTLCVDKFVHRTPRAESVDHLTHPTFPVTVVHCDHDYDCDDDEGDAASEVSSVGSGGISKFIIPKKPTIRLMF